MGPGGIGFPQLERLKNKLSPSAPSLGSAPSSSWSSSTADHKSPDHYLPSPPPPALICGGAAALAVAVDIAVAVAGGVVNVVVVVVGVGVGAVVVTSLLKLPKGPPRGRLGLYVAQRPATRGCCPEARHAGGWDFMFWLWLWLWRWWLCWWWSCPEASHAGGCAQKPATRGYCPEARHAGGWDFRFWLCLGLWWWCDAGRQGR